MPPIKVVFRIEKTTADVPSQSEHNISLLIIISFNMQNISLVTFNYSPLMDASQRQLFTLTSQLKLLDENQQPIPKKLDILKSHRQHQDIDIEKSTAHYNRSEKIASTPPFLPHFTKSNTPLNYNHADMTEPQLDEFPVLQASVVQGRTGDSLPHYSVV